MPNVPEISAKERFSRHSYAENLPKVRTDTPYICFRAPLQTLKCTEREAKVRTL